MDKREKTMRPVAGKKAEKGEARMTIEETRAHLTERERLLDDPNFNQAGNGAGSGDQSSGSQTGADID